VKVDHSSSKKHEELKEYYKEVITIHLVMRKHFTEVLTFNESKKQKNMQGKCIPSRAKPFVAYRTLKPHQIQSVHKFIFLFFNILSVKTLKCCYGYEKQNVNLNFSLIQFQRKEDSI
jgi:hypothetical protein